MAKDKKSKLMSGVFGDSGVFGELIGKLGDKPGDKAKSTLSRDIAKKTDIDPVVKGKERRRLINETTIFWETYFKMLPKYKKDKKGKTKIAKEQKCKEFQKKEGKGGPEKKKPGWVADIIGGFTGLAILLKQTHDDTVEAIDRSKKAREEYHERIKKWEEDAKKNREALKKLEMDVNVRKYWDLQDEIKKRVLAHEKLRSDTLLKHEEKYPGLFGIPRKPPRHPRDVQKDIGQGPLANDATSQMRFRAELKQSQKYWDPIDKSFKEIHGPGGDLERLHKQQKTLGFGDNPPADPRKVEDFVIEGGKLIPIDTARDVNNLTKGAPLTNLFQSLPIAINTANKNSRVLLKELVAVTKLRMKNTQGTGGTEINPTGTAKKSTPQFQKGIEPGGDGPILQSSRAAYYNSAHSLNVPLVIS